MYWYFRVYPNLEAWDFPLLTPNCIFQTVAKCCQELTIHGRSLLSPQKHNRDRETIICDWEIRCGIITASLKQKPSRNIFINFKEHIFGGTRRLVIDNNESRHPVLLFRTMHAVSLILYNCWSFYSDIILRCSASLLPVWDSDSGFFVLSTALLKTEHISHNSQYFFGGIELTGVLGLSPRIWELLIVLHLLRQI